MISTIIAIHTIKSPNIMVNNAPPMLRNVIATIAKIIAMIIKTVNSII